MNETNFNPAHPVTVYVAASCKGNPGPGGWGCFMRKAKSNLTLSGNERHTTSKCMELRASIRALERLTYPSTVTIHTSSKYLVDGMTQWLSGWMARCWTKADGTPVINQDLWERLGGLSRTHHVRWVWVPAAKTPPEGLTAWRLAQQAAQQACNGL